MNRKLKLHSILVEREGVETLILGVKTARLDFCFI